MCKSSLFLNRLAIKQEMRLSSIKNVYSLLAAQKSFQAFLLLNRIDNVKFKNFEEPQAPIDKYYVMITTEFLEPLKTSGPAFNKRIPLFFTFGGTSVAGI